MVEEEVKFCSASLTDRVSEMREKSDDHTRFFAISWGQFGQRRPRYLF